MRRRRGIEELARIGELVWRARLASWAARLAEDRQRMREALGSRAPTEPDAAAVWQRFAQERTERLAALEERLERSRRGMVAARARLGRAMARHRAAVRARARAARAAWEALAHADVEDWTLARAAAQGRDQG